MNEEDAKQFANAFSEEPVDEVPVEQPAEEPKEPETPPKKEEEPEVSIEKEEETPAEEPKEEEKKEEEPPAKEEEPKEPETPAEEEPVEEAKPLTKDDVTSIIKDLRNEERVSTQDLETATNDIIEAFYPNGLTNTLVDDKSGKELKTPQDVVDASGGEMSIEQATQWLMNEQYKLDKQVEEIKHSAKDLAELNVSFRQGGKKVLEKYQPLFKAYPQVQNKVWDLYKEMVKEDKERGIVLSAPDIEKFYDNFLDPYRMAFEHGQKQAATAPPPKEPEAPEPPKPSAKDRLDESGDGGGTDGIDDPNDFAQQVAKELKQGV